MLASLLFAVTAHDPMTFVLAPLALAIPAAAVVVPTRRAMRADPMVAMRGD